jgi:uncharacterized protein YjbJ (UPF0337 family)
VTLREIKLHASSAAAKEYYALDYFRHSTGALASWIDRARGRRFYSCPPRHCRDRISYPANSRSSALNGIGTRVSPRLEGPSQQVVEARIINMNKLQFKGSWNEIKGKLKQQYAQLTDDDLKYAEGKDDELIGRLQKKLGKSAEEVRHILEG